MTLLPRILCTAFLCSLLLIGWQPTVRAKQLLGFVAASMTDVMNELGQAYEAGSGDTLVFSFASSGALARQMEAGAPVDIFISANRDWVDWSKDRELLSPVSVTEFAHNSLVVAVRNEVENWADIEGLLTTERFAMGEPESTPAGNYARQALTARGLWARAKDKAVFGETVRIALKRVALGEVEAAIVYRTDALAEPSVKPVFTFNDSDHDPILYFAAATATAGLKASAFVSWLGGKDAAAILEKHGFTPAGSGN